MTTSSLHRRPPPDTLLFLVLAVAVLLSLVAVAAFDRANAATSLWTLSNLVGPTAQTLLHGQGLSVCTEAMGTPGNPICFHAARMPLPSAVVALGDSLLGNHLLRVAFFKTLLLLLPLLAAISLALRARPRRGWRRLLAALLLLLPFVLTPFLADVVNLQVEEGYSYSLLALAFALVLFLPAARATLAQALLFGLTVAALYLSKSSMLPAAALLTLAFLVHQRRRPASAALVLLLALLTPACWAIWQHHTAGHYTLGTSLDGINLHKGNNPAFLAHYPPAPGETLDQFDADLNRGHAFPDEWTFNTFHQQAALAYIRANPGPDAHAAMRKLTAILFSLRKLGSEPAHGAMRLVESGGILLFRLLLWSALLLSLAGLVRPWVPNARFAAATFLLLVAAVALPYLLGFAYTRHISVLIYPSALLCCRLLLPADRAPRAVH